MSEYVRVVDLEPVISKWLIGQQRVGDGELVFGFMAPQTSLAFDSGVNERKIRGILKHEYEHVMFETADAILRSIGQHYLLDNGSIEIVQWNSRLKVAANSDTVAAT